MSAQLRRSARKRAAPPKITAAASVSRRPRITATTTTESSVLSGSQPVTVTSGSIPTSEHGNVINLQALLATATQSPALVQSSQTAYTTNTCSIVNTNTCTCSMINTCPNSVCIPTLLPINTLNSSSLIPAVQLSTASTPSPIASISEDIAYNVPQNLKDKISRSEYIDLACLLNLESSFQDSQKLIIKNGELVIQSQGSDKKITSIDQWTTAFIIFTSIFCSTHVNRFQELLKYMYDIRLGAKRCMSLNWKTYDEQYRLRKARNPDTLWSEVDVELWLVYMSSNQPTNVQPVSNNSRLRCYNFNYNGKCYRKFCSYSHACLQCGGGHPFINCYLKQNARMGTASNRPHPSPSRSSVHARYPNFINDFSTRQQLRPRTPGSFVGYRSNTNLQ